jgi:TolB-like protein
MKETIMSHLSLRVLAPSALVAGLAVLLSGCVTSLHSKGDLLNSTRHAADRLAKNLDQPIVPDGGCILVASMVNVDDMNDSSSFGRIASEQIASALSREPHMFPIAEVRLRQNIFLKEQAGEFLLSREAIDVSKKHDAQALLVGTYAVGHESVYVSARIVNPLSNEIVSSYDFSVPFDDNTKTLLGYVRIHRASWWSRIWGGKDVWSKKNRDYYKYYPDNL